MRESSTYQAILEEGRAEGALAEAKKLLRLLGDDALGAPDDRTAALIEKITDLAQVEDLLLRQLSAANWQELLGSLVAGAKPGG